MAPPSPNSAPESRREATNKRAAKAAHSAYALLFDGPDFARTKKMRATRGCAGFGQMPPFADHPTSAVAFRDQIGIFRAWPADLRHNFVGLALLHGVALRATISPTLRGEDHKSGRTLA